MAKRDGHHRRREGEVNPMFLDLVPLKAPWASFMVVMYRLSRTDPGASCSEKPPSEGLRTCPAARIKMIVAVLLSSQREMYLLFQNYYKESTHPFASEGRGSE